MDRRNVVKCFQTSSTVWQLVCRYLSVVERAKLMYLCTSARSFVLQPQLEAEAMLEVFRLTYGMWPVGRRLHPNGEWRKGSYIAWAQILEAIYAKLQYILDPPELFHIGSRIWFRVNDKELDKLNIRLKFLSLHSLEAQSTIAQSSHYNGIVLYRRAPNEESSWSSFLQSLSRIQPSQRKTLMREDPLCLTEGLWWTNANELGIDSIDEEDLETVYKPDPQGPLYHRFIGCFTPYVVRVLLLEPSLTRRLIDVHDPLTPSLFLDAVQNVKLHTDEDVHLWGINVRDALSKHRDVWTTLYIDFWPATLESTGLSVGQTHQSIYRLSDMTSKIEYRGGLTVRDWSTLFGRIEYHEWMTMEEARAHLMKCYSDSFKPFSLTSQEGNDLEDLLEGSHTTETPPSKAILRIDYSPNPTKLIPNTFNRRIDPVLRCYLYIGSGDSIVWHTSYIQ